MNIKELVLTPEEAFDEALFIPVLYKKLAIRWRARSVVQGRRRLLDLGGGPGTYAAHFCLAHPGLSATVFDLPDTGRVAARIAARYGLEGRVDFRGGAFLEDDLGGPYDAVWLSHILHGEGPEECRGIIRKAADALEPGGVFLVHEFILDDSKDGPVYPALFSLNMLLGTPSVIITCPRSEAASRP